MLCPICQGNACYCDGRESDHLHGMEHCPEFDCYVGEVDPKPIVSFIVDHIAKTIAEIGFEGPAKDRSDAQNRVRKLDANARYLIAEKVVEALGGTGKFVFAEAHIRIQQRKANAQRSR